MTAGAATTVDGGRELSARGRLLQRVRRPIPLAVAVLVVLRLLEIRGGASSDEGGFLVIAGQWHDGSSLYGDYWVDRPPLLIAFFQVADLTGGLLSLRLLGVLAAVTSVLLLASTARRVFDQQAADWTGVVAAALLVTPLYGVIDVNGELVALPLLALGIRAAVEAVTADDVRRVRGAALVAGIAAVAALLVKQNLVDVLVFGAVCWVVAVIRGQIAGRRVRDLVLFAALGGVATYAVVMLLALAHGTGPVEVYEATYPFRIDAAKVIEAAADTVTPRLHLLGLSFLLSGAALVLIGFLALGIRRSRSPAVVWALVATGAWAGFSVLAGGSYWLHYLVETVPVVALAAGALSASAPLLLRPLVGMLVASSLVAAAVVLVEPTATPGTTVGEAIEKSAVPGDTVLSLFGDPDILRSTGMSSPYPYLWSLPSRTLDASMDQLRAVLAGPDAPAWLVVRGPATADRLVQHGAMAVIDRRFAPVGRVCGRTVYLRVDLTRAPLRGGGRCHGVQLP